MVLRGWEGESIQNTGNCFYQSHKRKREREGRERVEEDPYSWVLCHRKRCQAKERIEGKISLEHNRIYPSPQASTTKKGPRRGEKGGMKRKYRIVGV